MKKYLLSLFLIYCSLLSYSQNVGIGTNTPHASAALEIQDTSRGILIPRMTMVQRNAIQNPAEGLMIYQTDSTRGFWFWDGILWRMNGFISNPMNGTQGGEMMYWNGNLWLTIPPGLNGQTLTYCDGVPTWGGCTPSVTTSAISSISYTTVVCEGNVTSDGGTTVTERGFCWSINSNPTVLLNTKTLEGAGTGVFTSYITDLLLNTTYHIRAYAKNSAGYKYGSDSIFTTNPPRSPIVTTTNVSFSSGLIICGGNVTDSGGLQVTSRGVCWSTNNNPKIETNNTKVIGNGIGVFSSYIFGLNTNTGYYLRAYAINGIDTAYGNEVFFTTPNHLIGELFAGGIIFYLDNTGDHGMVCTTTDQGTAIWGCVASSVNGTSTAFGSGLSNTNRIIIVGCYQQNTAAKICDNLILNNCSDWYLPSRDELILIYQQLVANGIGVFQFDLSYWGYWSSSEAAGSQGYGAWYVNLSNGYTNIDIGKNASCIIRPIRNF